MKYWNTLTNLENEIMRVREFKVLFGLIANASESATPDEMQTAMWTLFGMIEDIDSKMYDEFQSLWDQIREDSPENDDEDVYESHKRWSKIVDSLQNSQVSAN